MWGSQFWLQPHFQAAFGHRSLKVGGGQNCPPYTA
jgi:hypothetical protein